jgi:hypothetical protein
MDLGRRSDAGFETLDVPLSSVVRVTGRVSCVVLDRTVTDDVAERGLEDGAAAVAIESLDPIETIESWDPIETILRHRLVSAATAVLVVVTVVLGDNGPWIVAVPALAALGGAWVDRRIRFSFAEGFIGYCGDLGSPRGVDEDDRHSSWGQSAPATR